MTSLGPFPAFVTSVVVVKDRCRRGPCGGGAPAPNETLGSVARQVSKCKQFLQGEVAVLITSPVRGLSREASS
jgi:hypothetical protein